MPNPAIAELIAQVSAESIRETLRYLCQDPLPYRKLNYTLPGHEKCTLHEADDYIAARLEACGYSVEREAIAAQAFACDESKPKAHQYSAPKPDDPWYTTYNLHARKLGRTHPDEVTVVMAHKDSQSWVDSPGAYDNAVGTTAVIEMARVLAHYENERTLWFLFCNEEHVPWTSANAAQNAMDRGENVIAAFNIDSLGGKSQADVDAGRKTNATLYTVPEGKWLADLMPAVVEQYGLGLEQTVTQREYPNDDDGSFVKAGYLSAIINVGSFPYGDPDYHLESDTFEHVDIENVWLATQASLAAILTVDSEGQR
jgi:hypothetical protein